MKSFLLGTLLLTSVAAYATHSEDHDNESYSEKAADMGRDSKRAVKKGYHRTKEAVCMKGDAGCAAQKAKHRVIEGTDATVDKAKEVKNKID